MKEKNALKNSVGRIASLFLSKEKKADKQEKKNEKQKYMRLNFILLNAAFNAAKKNKKDFEKQKISFSPLFTPDIMDSDNPHLVEITKQAHRCCTKQDLHLFPFKQFFLRNEFTMKRVIEWRLSKYIKGKDQLKSIVEIMKQTPPDIFSGHLVTLINQDGEVEAKLEDVNKEAKEIEKNWDLWKHHADGDPLRISRP